MECFQCTYFTMETIRSSYTTKCDYHYAIYIVTVTLIFTEIPL